MSLADIVCLDGQHLTLTPVLQGRVLILRLVSRKVKAAVLSNFFLKIKIRINDAGPNVDFLQMWRGSMSLQCTSPWKPDSKWFRSIEDALARGRLRPLSLLSLLVAGKNLHPLVEMLVRIGHTFQQLQISYRGNGKELLAAAALFASLGRSLTLEISVQGIYWNGAGRRIQTPAWLHLLASSAKVISISFRSARRPILARPLHPLLKSRFIVRERVHTREHKCMPAVPADLCDHHQSPVPSSLPR